MEILSLGNGNKITSNFETHLLKSKATAYLVYRFCVCDQLCKRLCDSLQNYQPSYRVFNTIFCEKKVCKLINLGSKMHSFFVAAFFPLKNLENFVRRSLLSKLGLMKLNFSEYLSEKNNGIIRRIRRLTFTTKILPLQTCPSQFTILMIECLQPQAQFCSIFYCTLDQIRQ